VLYSRSANVALAHYPKAAGSSLAVWFLARFPDAVASDPLDPHDPVRRALRRHGILARRSTARLLKAVSAPARRVLKLPAAGPGIPLVIGVLREPFDMLVSLYRFWRRRHAEMRYPAGSIQHAAGSGTFRQFLLRAVVAREVPNYHDFFDVGGPAWPRTRLLDFRSIEPALESVCREIGVEASGGVPACNVAPSPHDAAEYLAEAGELVDAVRAHFRWYYEEGVALAIRGDAAPLRLRRAA